MINQKALDNLNKGINSVPCPLCGKSHGVNLSQNSTHIFAKSSADGIFLPTGDKLFVEVEDGSCDGFKQRLHQYLMAHISLLIESPFDRI